MNTIVNKTCNIILDILIFLFGIIFLISVYSDVQVKLLKKDHADFFGFSTFEVQTGSMSPSINPSDVIIVKTNHNPEVKDIITYKSGNDYITHRVVEAYKGTYVTKGDANTAKDEAIKQSQIVGSVVKILPKFGVIRKTILNPIVLITLIITVYIIGFMFGKKEKDLKVDIMIEKIKEILKRFRKEEKKAFVFDDKDLLNEETIAIIEEKKAEIEKTEIEEIKERFSNPNIVDEDLDKTVFYRKISVDKEDLNPNVQIVEEEKEEIDLTEVKADLEKEITEDDKDVLVKLEYLNKRKKKFANIIEKVMYIKEEELKELVNSINNSEKLKTNESTIIEEFTKVYIDGKYYNYTGEVNTNYNAKNMNSKLEEALNAKADSLIKKYKGNDNKFKDKVMHYLNVYSLLLQVESLYLTNTDMETKINNYKKKIVKYMKNYYQSEKDIVNKIKELIIIQKEYAKVREVAIKKLDTNTFELKYNNITAKKNMYGLVLKHNINFSKIYSDYIVDKTYDEGIVAEDKVLVTANLLLTKIARDMLDTEFKNRYLLYIPTSLFEKDNKLNKVLKLLDDECAKKCILLLVSYKTLIANKKTIKTLKKDGYRIALVFDDYEQIKAKDKVSISLADYIFADKKINKVLGISGLVPSDLKQHVITEDILSKVDITGGHS